MRHYRHNPNINKGNYAVNLSIKHLAIITTLWVALVLSMVAEAYATTTRCTTYGTTTRCTTFGGGTINTTRCTYVGGVLRCTSF